MLKYPVKALRSEQLRMMSRPPTGRGVSEAIPHVYYDTEVYTDNATTSLNFFTNTKATRQLSNLSPAGSLPKPYFFRVYAFMVDIKTVPSATAWADVYQLLFGANANAGPTFTFVLSDKDYGPWPLSCLHGTGGVQGFSDAAAAPEQYANNGPIDGGFWVDGSILIPPNEGFRAELAWEAAEDISGDLKIRLSMAGVLHRKVL